MGVFRLPMKDHDPGELGANAGAPRHNARGIEPGMSEQLQMQTANPLSMFGIELDHCRLRV
jgi:hypothetical protein